MRTPLTVTFLCLLLAACGGGGGSGETRLPGAGQWSAVEWVSPGGKPRVQVAADERAVAIWPLSDGPVAARLAGGTFDLERGWTARGYVDLPHDISTVYQDLAMNSAGTAMAVWSRNDGIWSVPADPSGFGVPRPVESQQTQSSQPFVAVAPSGEALVIFQSGEKFSRSAPQSAGWGPAISPVGMRLWQPYFDAQGTAYSFAFAGDPFTISVATLAPGADQWAAGVPLPSPISGSGTLAVRGDGRVLAVGSDLGRLYAVLGSPATGWSQPVLLNGAADAAGYEPQAAFDAVGNAMVVWTQRDDPAGDERHNTVWARRYVEGQGWQAATPLDGVPGRFVREAQLAVDRRGNAVVAWTNDAPAGGDASPWVNLYTAGRGWSGAQAVGVSGQQPAVAISPNGTAHVMWWSFGEGIYTRRYRFPQPWEQ
jgi:hypothetical protein